MSCCVYLFVSFFSSRQTTCEGTPLFFIHFVLHILYRKLPSQPLVLVSSVKYKSLGESLKPLFSDFFEIGLCSPEDCVLALYFPLTASWSFLRHSFSGIVARSGIIKSFLGLFQSMSRMMRIC